MSSLKNNDKTKNNETRLPLDATRILLSLASTWTDVPNSESLQMIPLKGAMTNQVFQIKWQKSNEGDVSKEVIVRIYGEGVDVFFNRDVEIQTFECMSKLGQGPRLLGRFDNGRVEEFIHARVEIFSLSDRISYQVGLSLSQSLGHKEDSNNELVSAHREDSSEADVVAAELKVFDWSSVVLPDVMRCGSGMGRTLSAADPRDPEISALIASKLREFHDLDMPGPKNVILWDRLRNWLTAAKNLCPLAEATAFCLDNLEEEISLLEKAMSGDTQHVGFCHNDLQYGNIMMDEETRSITIIDYEYAGYNHIAFDVANHFCEMAANYHTETPHVMDFGKYPGDQPSDLDVEQLVQDVEKYTLVSHLYWGLWGIISELVNDIDFDYMEYARQRFHQYWSRKSMLLISSEAPPP
ncbi:hypothetical protein GIB67_016918 [Kingdonia uniflora]|uniref:Choline kinase n=1 Tax=Kingdonia uniflora TaxID=39325 RepID=A0A7J7M3H0_9MAGN|nr:hypothetical protein GIB67_016918 [Kingdonia uniflora]